MLKLVTENTESINLDDIASMGAKKMLLHALNVEVEQYVESLKSELDEQGNRLVVRNGKGKERKLTLGSGTIDLKAPRVNDRRDGCKFTSAILPPYLRKSPKVESLLPVLYLKGISTGKMADALKEFLGEGSMGLSPASISKLLKKWEGEFEIWQKRIISKKFVYMWADGVNVQIRLGDDKKIGLLVIIGVTESGEKELLAVHPGYRESKESWLCVMRSLIERGVQAPLLAIGDGALGFWAALRECEGFKTTKEQRCWVHKIANVLDSLPKRVQPDVKSLLHEMMKAPDVKSAELAKCRFESIYKDKYPKAAKCLDKDWKVLTTFFNFPAAHWQSIRSTNPIESSFASVKLRTRVTRGAGSASMASALAFKLLQECEKRWRKINSPKEITNLLNGVEYRDGIVLPRQQQNREGAAS